MTQTHLIYILIRKSYKPSSIKDKLIILHEYRVVGIARVQWKDVKGKSQIHFIKVLFYTHVLEEKLVHIQ